MKLTPQLKEAMERIAFVMKAKKLETVEEAIQYLNSKEYYDTMLKGTKKVID